MEHIRMILIIPNTRHCYSYVPHIQHVLNRNHSGHPAICFLAPPFTIFKETADKIRFCLPQHLHLTIPFVDNHIALEQHQGTQVSIHINDLPITQDSFIMTFCKL
jgi:hypothetical protein